jgi:3-isopropylmalate/(R)-2-methylmalate dehydratase small subunit
LECLGIVEAVDDGDVLEVEITGGTVKNVRTGAELSFTPLPSFMVEILGEGGLVTYIRNHLNEW